MKELRLRNAQRKRKLNVKLARELVVAVLRDHLSLHSWMLAIDFVTPARMAALNEKFLGHSGSTDVITFDYREGYGDELLEQCELAGQIFISVADAEAQAMEFGTSWQEELARYIVHGILHLRGFDDLSPGPRKIMKREENRLVRKLSAAWPIPELGA
jgi:rRNA maturation RNase YbeY